MLIERFLTDFVLPVSFDFMLNCRGELFMLVVKN